MTLPRIRFVSILPVLLAAMVFYFTTPMDSLHELYAQTGTQTMATPDAGVTGTPARGNLATSDPTTGTSHTCSSFPEAKGGRVLGAIVPCLVHTIQTSTEVFSQKVITMFRPIFYAFLTLVIILFGVKTVQGEQHMGGQAVLFVIKVAFVIGMMEMIPTMVVPATYGIISDGVNIVTGTIGANGAALHCDVNNYGDANTPPVWKAMDCVLGKLYGFATGKGPPDANGKPPVNMLLASSGVGLLTGFFFGGTLGVAVFFALIGVLWSILTLVLRTTLAFLNGYLIVCILLIIAPLFLPLVLLKVTNDYFERWWRAILGGLIMPVMVAAYAMFALMVYDKILFSPDSKLQTLFDFAKVQGALGTSKAPCNMPISNDPSFSTDGLGISKDDADKIMKIPFIKNMNIPGISGSSNACALTSMPVFDVTKVDSQDFKDKKNIMLKLFTNCIELFIMAFLIAEGMDQVTGMIGALTGSSMSGAALSTRSKLEQAVISRFQGAKQQASGAYRQPIKDAAGNITGYSDAYGTSFISRTVGDGTSENPGAAKQFLGGIFRN